MIRPNENPLMEQVRTMITDHDGLLSDGIIAILNNYTSRMELKPLIYTYHAVKYLINLHYQLYHSLNNPIVLSLSETEVLKREKRIEAWLIQMEGRIRLIADCEAVCVDEINKHFFEEPEPMTVRELLGQ